MIADEEETSQFSCAEITDRAIKVGDSQLEPVTRLDARDGASARLVLAEATISRDCRVMLQVLMDGKKHLEWMELELSKLPPSRRKTSLGIGEERPTGLDDGRLPHTTPQ